MPELILSACTATPFGSYLKSLGVLRLLSEQKGPDVRGWWTGDTFTLECALTPDELLGFFLDEYSPTPIVAPWNGGSGFYPKDNQEGIAAIEASIDPRFAMFRAAIATCRSLPEVQQGKGESEDDRRTAILRHCRNRLPDSAVEWLDACVSIAADGSRSFASVLGTGGNEGRLDYTNGFMSRLATLLIAPAAKTPVKALLDSALFGTRTTALQPAAAGQFDPGRAGGANQGPGVAHEGATNPWDLVLTLEGAVAWASGICRRQGIAYRTILCSPFTVRANSVGYSSAAAKDKESARAEIWTPLWRRPVGYPELKALLREGRASIQGRPASNALEFAEAACSLGVDRGIDRFVRYSLLKRRGDSYVASPAGTFPTGYRPESDLIRRFHEFFAALSNDLPKGAEDLNRNIESAIYQALLTGGKERMRELMAALGRLLRRIVATKHSTRTLDAGPWTEACGFDVPEVRIAAALASIWTADVGSIADNLFHGDKRFAWLGADLPARLFAVLNRRLQLGNVLKATGNPLGAACALHPGDTTLFIEQSVDDALIEDLLFAFSALHWKSFESPYVPSVDVLPTYAVLKHLFLPGAAVIGPKTKRLRADPRILPLLAAGNIEHATAIAVSRLRVAGLCPLNVSYTSGVNPRRLAAALLIPVRSGKLLTAGIFNGQEESKEACA